MSLFTDTVSLDGFDFTVVSTGKAIIRISRGRADSVNPDLLTEQAICELSEYFIGRRKAFSFPIAIESASGLTDFRRKTWTALMAVPYGETVSYGELAMLAGCPGGARAVGGAVGANELLIVIPCHRVISSNGTLGGFSSGLDLKQKLLKIEKNAADVQ